MQQLWEGLQKLWNGLLDWLSQVITPNWNDVIGWLPSLLTGLLLLLFAFLGLRWLGYRGLNRTRVPGRVAGGAPPAGVHLPGPSPWPFVLPVGALLLLAGLIAHPGRLGAPNIDPGTGALTPSTPVALGDVFNLPLIALGLLLSLVGIIGWYRDANREWDVAEHPERRAIAEARPPVAALPHDQLTLPPGVHLPGPSPWPFFAPVALGFIFFGLIFSGWVVGAGVIMALIALYGWYRDAGREYRQVEAGQAPEPVTRDPERAFHKGLVGVYITVAAIALLLTAAPQLIAIANARPPAAPSPSPSASGGGELPSAIKLMAKGVKFDQATLTVPAGKPFTISFTNNDAVPHNVAIFEGSDAGGPNVFRGKVFVGPGVTEVYDVKALAAGSYYFHCDVHPSMNGTLIAK